MSKTRLAITGNMGSGKTLVSQALTIMGVPVYDCDSRAKMLMQSDAVIRDGLVRMLGRECYRGDGMLDRGWVATRLFADKECVARVNALVHPRVKEDFIAWADAEKSDIVAVESAVLYESGLVDAVDCVLLVWTDEETAISRVVERSGLMRSQVLSRLKNQMSADELLLLSDYSLYNNGNSPILPALIKLLEEIADKNID